MISLKNIVLSHATQQVLKGVTLNIDDGECVAVVGPNGCGKSTLLRVIAGIYRPDSGSINYPSRSKIGLLPQEADLDAEHPLEEELLGAFDDVRRAMAEMEQLEHRMSEMEHDSPDAEEIYEKYSECSHVVEQHQAYAIPAQIRRVASGLGFTQDDMFRSCREFSGGWKMRILLARLLLERPDIILLDEPTNHLDLESMLWLEEWVKTCGRTVIMVSHERDFMDRLADRIVCVEQGTAEIYRGDYAHYLLVSAAKREALWKAYEQQREEIAATEAFINRFRYNAARSSQVQSRVKQLAKVERLETPFHPEAIHFKFPPAPASYSDVVIMENLGHAYNSSRVFSNGNLTIRRGDKVGLVGVNGAGKSTLLRIVAGKMAPAEGTCDLGGKVRREYFAQYESDTLRSDQSLLNAIEAEAPVGEAQRARELLGAFLFSGDAVNKPLSALSGGERTRFRLARMLFSPANLLLLDEPTNHLDVTSRATVERALRSYTGTLIVVSHDPVFMNQVTDRIIEIENGRVSDYPGSYEDYLRVKRMQAAEGFNEEDDAETEKPSAPRVEARPVREPATKEDRKADRERRKDIARRERALERSIEEAEKIVEQCETRLKELSAKMAEPEVASNFGKLRPLSLEHGETKGKRDRATEEWVRLSEELERLHEEASET
jgi:ATP-binding cassette subfamily F protein 3